MPPGADTCTQAHSGALAGTHQCDQRPAGRYLQREIPGDTGRCSEIHVPVRPAPRREVLATGDTGRFKEIQGDAGRCREMQGDTRTGATSSQSGDTCKRRPPCRRFARPPLRRQSPACSPGCRGSSDVISRHQSPSVAIRRDPSQSDAIRCNQVHSGANQRTFDLPLSACMVAQTSAARARS